MDYEAFEALMGGIESLVVSVGLIVGGLWALISFKALREIAYRRIQIEKSEVERRKTEAEIRQIELGNKQQAVLDISIEASQQSLPNDPARYVSAVVEIVNNGSRNTRLPTSRDPFTVRTVELKEDGSFEFVEGRTYMVRRASNPMKPPPNVIVRAGGRERIPFFFRVDGPGLYLLTFRVTMDEKEQEVAREEGFAYAGSWVAKRYVIVE